MPVLSLPRVLLAAFALSGLGLVSLGSSRALAADLTLTAPQASEDLTDKLRGSSAVLATPLDADVQSLLAASLSDYRTMVQVLYDAGHYAPVVSILLDGHEAARIDPIFPPKSISTVDIRVDPGPVFRFGVAEVTPLPATSDADLPEEFATGEIAGSGTIRDAANASQLAWRRAGHAKVQLAEQAITADNRAATLNARLRMAPGPQLRMGEMRITAPSAVRADAIRRIAGFATNETFHPDLVAKSATRLRRTGAFSAVTLREAKEPNPDGTLDFDLLVEDMPPRRLTFGVEVSSTDGIELTASWMHRNLFGGAEKLRFETRLSGIGGNTDLDGRIGLRLDRPATLGPDDNVFYTAEVERLDEEHYTALRGMGLIGVRRVFSDQFFTEGAIGFSSSLAEDVFGKRRFKYGIGTILAEYDARDSRVSATSGYFLRGRATAFVGTDGSASGLQLTMDGRAYRRLGSGDRFVLAGRAQLGSVIGPALHETAPNLLFFSGGGGSVRGQDYQSLGVPVAGGTAGGRGYLALSGELRSKVTNKISLVGFYDIGFVDPDSFVSSDSENHSGAGLGLRYDVAGIGAIRFDLAYPVTGGNEDGLQFYFGIGQAF